MPRNPCSPASANRSWGTDAVALPLLVVGHDLGVEPAAHAGPELLVLVVEEISLHGRSVSLSLTMAQNVLGDELIPCSTDPLTGFYRNGCCDTGADDHGVHTVCAVMTDEFLAFSKDAGQRPEHADAPVRLRRAAGRRPVVPLRGPVDRGARGGPAPAVVLAATHARTLEWADLADLQAHAVD